MVKATRAVSLYEPTHRSAINGLSKTRKGYGISRMAADLLPLNSREMAALDPTILLAQMEARLTTKEGMKYRRLQFEGAKRMDNENL